MSEDIVRVLRVVEYVGPRAWVEDIVARSIHGTKKCGSSFLRQDINAATIGAYPDILIESGVDKKEDKE